MINIIYQIKVGPGVEAPVMHAYMQDISGQILFWGVTRRKKSNLSEQQDELASSLGATKNAWYRFLNDFSNDVLKVSGL